MKSKRTGKDLPFIKIKSDDPTEAEALLSGGLVYQKTGIIFRVEEFKTTPSILQCFKCQGFGHKALNCTKNEKCVVCGEAHSHKNCPNKEKRKPKCANCRDLMLQTIEAVLHIRTKLLGSMWSKNRFLCISPKTSFTTTYQQHIQFYCGANCLPSHKCGNSNRSATTVH